MIDTVLLFLLGFILLAKGADVFVNSAASIAKKMGVSELIIGLTLVAVGTSIPEYASAVTSSLMGQSDLITGNIVGANINNLALVIGIAAFISKIKVRPEVVLRDGYIMLFAGVLFYISALNARLSYLEGVLFILLYIGYTVFLFEANLNAEKTYRFREFIPYFFKFQYLITIGNGVKKYGLSTLNYRNRGISVAELKLDRIFREALLKDLLLMLLSSFAIVFGVNYFIRGAVFFTDYFTVPETFVGVMLAFGTTLPELTVSFTASRKGYGDISVGTILGSCITNILLIVGTCAIINPVNISEITIYYTAPFMVFLMIMSVFFIVARKEFGRKEAAAFILTYTVYMALLIFKSLL